MSIIEYHDRDSAPPARLSLTEEEYCWAIADGYTCTEPAGHLGAHVADGPRHRCAEWFDE